MIKILLKQKGKIIRDSPLILPEFISHLDIFLNSLIKDSFEEEIELNIVLGKIGDELIYDNRIIKEYASESSYIERKNRCLGIILTQDQLVGQFKDKKISYITLNGLTFRTIFHEFSHFKDPYKQQYDHHNSETEWIDFTAKIMNFTQSKNASRGKLAKHKSSGGQVVYKSLQESN